MREGTLRQSAKSSERGEGRATEIAYRALKARILENELAAGTQLLEQEVALQLGLSRTPVREAFQRLEREGLLEIVPRHGIRISLIRPEDMREIYEVLSSLEPAAAELLAERKLDRKAMQPLVEACDEMERALERDDRRGWAAADTRFHLALVESCGNRRLCEMIKTVWDQAHRARMATLLLRPPPTQSTREHRAILKAILAGDPEKAGALYRAHRKRAGAELLNIIDRHQLRHL
jgi:DNA-binding GntR family transcriptional regulator